MKNFFLMCIVLSSNFITIYPIKNIFEIPQSYPSDEQIQKEIDEHQEEVITFIKHIKTIEDLQLPLPIPSRSNPNPKIPALLDLLKKRRNASLIEMIIAKKLPIRHSPTSANDNGLFNHWIFKGKSKVIRHVCELHKKYNLDFFSLVNTYLEKDNWTPLMAAVNLRKTASIKVLLSYGALVNACTKNGQTALHIATAGFRSTDSKRKTKIIIQLLCNAGIDLTIKDENGKTARDLAYERGLYSEVHIIDSCKWLVEFKKSIKGQNTVYLSLLPPEILESLSEYMVDHPVLDRSSELIPPNTTPASAINP